jgi:nucleotide-binding universal stress UspA family protein
MQKIVVGISGSEASKSALRWAIEDARARTAEVVALHAYEVEVPSPDATTAAPFDIPALVTELHEGAQAFVSDVVREVVGPAATVDVAPIAVEDETALHALVEASRDADLVVVGYGLVSLELARHAACPVLIYRDSS